MRRREVVRPAVCALLVPALSLSACYVYVPPPGSQPAPGTSVALDLNDQGRVGLGATLGPGVSRITGRLLTGSDSAYAVSVSEVQTVRGDKTNWTGERLDVRRAFVNSVLERKLSRSRTALVAGTALAAVAAFVLTRSLNGGGNGGDDGNGGQPPPTTSRVLPPPRAAAP